MSGDIYKELTIINQVLSAAYMNKTHINMKKMRDYEVPYNRLKMFLGVSGSGVHYRNVDKAIAKLLRVSISDGSLFRKVRNDVAHLYDFNDVNDSEETYYKDDNIKYMRYSEIESVETMIYIVRRALGAENVKGKGN